MKKILLTLFACGLLILPSLSFAQQSNDFEIIPEASGNVGKIVENIGKTGGNVWDTYNQEAQELQKKGDIGGQFASGVMTRDTILDYIVYLVRFLSQVGIVIGVMMIIYAGYLYATSIFSPSNMTKGKSAITNAIIGVLVVAFSYAIMKILTSAFLS